MTGAQVCVWVALLCATSTGEYAAASTLVGSRAALGAWGSAVARQGVAQLKPMPRLRGGSSKIDLDDQCVIDPARLAGVGIGFKKDKMGNHVVVSLVKGWPAALSGEIVVGDILLEVNDEPVAPLSTTALVQNMRGPEGSEVKLLLQRGEQGDLLEVCLERVLQGVVDPSDPVKKGYIESTIDLGFSLGGKASNLIPTFGGKGAKEDPGTAAAGEVSGEAGVGIGFSVDEEGNFVVSKLVSGGAAALSKQVKTGDVLVAVDGAELDDMSLKKLVKLLKGPVGSSVEVDLERKGELLSVSLTRSNPVVTKSASGSLAAGIYNSVTGIAASASSSVSGVAASTAGGASSILTSSLTSLSSLTSALPSLSFSKKAPDPAELVGVGLGIKKNQHGDFMVVDINANGPAAASGKFMEGDVLQKVGKQAVNGLKSAALRDLILGMPGSTVALSLCRWEAETNQWRGYIVSLTRQKKAAAPRKAPTPAPAGASPTPQHPHTPTHPHTHTPTPRHPTHPHAHTPTHPRTHPPTPHT
jgi:C-terminal processing protease CtpA/Prc